jgi:tRNA (cmo5U34)-methyltransferase
MSKYNIIAPYYDFLAQLVYWGSIERANTAFLDAVPANATLLIIGGGTGKSLELLNPQLELDYLEPSSKMIGKARKRSSPRNTSFILQTFEEFAPNKKYDFVVCPFFLDQFKSHDLPGILTKIDCILKPEGQVLVSDFNIPKGPFKIIKQVLLNTTIGFFRVVTGLKIRRLENISNAMEKNNFRCTNSKAFYFGMIFSSTWIKLRH